MDLHAIPTERLRFLYQHGRISESELIAEITAREDEQPDTQEESQP